MQSIGGRRVKLYPVAVGVFVTAFLAGSFASPARAATVPPAPTNVTAAAGDETIVISWLQPDDGGSPITDYQFKMTNSGVVLYEFVAGTAQTSITLQGADDVVANTLTATYWIAAVNDVGTGGFSEPSNEVTPMAGAPAPQLALAAISPAGGSATTDGGGGPTPSDPVTTTVTAPATAAGGTIAVAETTPSEAPAGFLFLGQEIVIESNLATDVSNPLRITFRVDPSFAPVTIFRDGVPIEDACIDPGIANPSPCIESGAGTTEITILTDHASRWNVGIASYAFDGFFSPVDNMPVTNSAKAGSGIPVRFGLGGDRGLNVFSPGFPKSQQVTCDAGSAVDGIEETTRTDAVPLTYSAGTGHYQYTWKSERAWAGTCRELIVHFRDGTEQRARFKFK